MTGRTILESRGVSKKFGDFTAVDRVSYALAEGEAAGIIGPNGAGKSTFFNLLTGLYLPTDGSIHFQNQDITTRGADQRVTHGLVRTFQLVSVFDSLTVADNLILSVVRFQPDFSKTFRFFLKRSDQPSILDSVRSALERVGIADKASLMTAELSYGDKRKLEIAMALALRPRVLLLDEPLAGLSDVEITDVLALVREVKKEFTLVIIEHKISRIMDLVSRLSVMHEGQVIAEGPPDEVLNNEQVRQVYWGEDTGRQSEPQETERGAEN